MRKWRIFRQKRVLLIGVGLLALVGIGLAAQHVRDIYKGSLEERVSDLASIQPGLGTVMIEYGGRFTSAYFAAKGGNWGLAQYQLKEATEIQEVGEITRPAKAPLLKNFEQTFLVPLQESVKAQDWSLYRQRFETAVAGCNGCHAATGHAYIQYTLPTQPAETYLNFDLKTKPR